MAATDIHGALRQIAPDNLAPVYVFIGEERFLVDRATHKVRAAVLHGGVEGFNDDVFHGKGLDAKRFVSAARTLPMMASMRFVLIRDVDGAAASELDALADYLENPSATTAVVMTADKLDGRSRFAKVAKKASYWIDAKPIKASGARTFVTAEAKERGHKLTPDAADALVDALGTDLAALDDALERLSLYVGKGQSIDLQAVETSVTRIRTESIWAMVDAVSMRDARTAL
ncbi:MAG: DNA polymerase III subunit delta, partial [Myxococcales bacterium]|nr:DNA polymerase III subunit delta [Myxococcales bacterium]